MNLAVIDSRNNARIINMNVQAVYTIISGGHLAWLDDSMFLWQVLLAKGLKKRSTISHRK